MKTVVIYNSQTGFTKRYAEWIAEAAGEFKITFPADRSLSTLCSV